MEEWILSYDFEMEMQMLKQYIIPELIITGSFSYKPFDA